MNNYIFPGPRNGTVKAPQSKSALHRLLICSVLSEKKSRIQLENISDDIYVTVDCLKRLGASFSLQSDGWTEITPIQRVFSSFTDFYAGESASTLRFLLPIAGAFGLSGSFTMSGNLPNRPLDPLADELNSHGMTVSKKNNKIMFSGKLVPGRYALPGNISSQFISGLLFALPLLSADSELEITDGQVSRSYVQMTESTLSAWHIVFEKQKNIYFIPGNQQFNGPEQIFPERDWSSAAPFLCMGALSDSGISVSGISQYSTQGDSSILNVLSGFGAAVHCSENTVTVSGNFLKGQFLDVSDMPDLLPVLSAVAAASTGTTEFIGAGRLRHKESDRLRSTATMLNSLGADVTETPDGLIIYGKPYLTGGIADSACDHRIAMAAAVAACACINPVTVYGGECVGKSYPEFWKDYNCLEYKQ